MSKHKKRTILIRKTLSWIAFRIYIFLFLIVERLSVKHADQFGRFLGGLLFYLSSHRRKIVEENGWEDVGYHFFIKRNGKIQKGRDLEITPSSQKGYNSRTISICLHGKNKFSKKQFESLRKLCLEIHRAYKGKITFHGHREVADEKTCPNFDYVKVLNLDAHGRMKGI